MNQKLTDLTELTAVQDGDFLYIVDVSDTTDGVQGTGKKITKFNMNLDTVPYLGSVSPASTPTGTGKAYWFALEDGTYTNFGGVIVAPNSIAIISRNSTNAYSITQNEISLNGYVKFTDVVNTLASTSATLPLSANQGKVLKDLVDTKVNTTVTDNLTSTSATNALSANQGRLLDLKIAQGIVNWTAKAFLINDEVSHLGKLWQANAAIVAGDVPGTSSKWVEVLSGYAENSDLTSKADLVVGKNKFDKSKALIGYYINEFNQQSVNSTYDVSDFVPVTVGQVLKSTHNMRAVTYFDINKNLVNGGSGVATQNITIPSGVSFIRFSIWHTEINIFQLELGTVSTTYEDYVKAVPDSQIPNTVQRKTDAVTLVDENVTEPKTTFFELSKNLFNPSEAVLGFYVLYLNGVLQSSASYNTTGFIPVTAGQNYTLSYKHQIAWYDTNKVYISGSNSTDGVQTQLAPTGAAYLRCSINITSYSTFQVELGSAKTAYVPYGFVLKKKYISKYFDELNLTKYDSLLGNDGKIISQASLALDSIIEVTDFPFHLKKGISMSIYADITTFGTISYGKGFAKYRGEYFTIDGTNVTQYYDSVLIIAKPHGLIIDTFLKSSFSSDDNGIANFILQSKTGYFKTTFTMANEMNYEPFIRANSQAITNVKLTVGSKDFQKPVWAFGDSYFGIGSGRWPGTMKIFGYFNFLINGLAGQSSGGAYADLLKCLNYGTPKYIIWCLGMNDSDSAFSATLEKLKTLCTTKDIKLILSTIPTVPTRNKEVIKTNVLASGYRHIDFYKAMGANSSGVWYSGYLDSDGVHPSQLGADALATQVLIDFPELMQYGKNL